MRTSKPSLIKFRGAVYRLAETMVKIYNLSSAANRPSGYRYYVDTEGRRYSRAVPGTIDHNGVYTAFDGGQWYCLVSAVGIRGETVFKTPTGDVVCVANLGAWDPETNTWGIRWFVSQYRSDSFLEPQDKEAVRAFGLEWSK